MTLEPRRHSIASLLAAVALVVTAVVASAGRAEAQYLGTFTWQTEPFCNVITVNVTQQGAFYTLDGYDDQCGAGQRAPVVGLATANPDGTIGLGFNVTVPGAAVQIGGRIALGGLGGPWTDSAGNSGHFAFGANTGGNPRPAPSVSLLAGGGFLASGAVSMTAVPASGPGTRMMWHPGKSAFRVGTVDAAAWDDANVGVYSIAMGHSTKASGPVSTALGNGTTASGQSSTAMGAFTTASGSKSTAMGDSTTASGPSSTAFGIDTTASGQSSTAFGDLTTASGGHSVALGLRSTAAGAHAFAMGDGSSAGGGNSVAFGASPRALGFESVSMGLRTTAAGNGSVALGSDASAGTGTFAFGDRSTTNVLASPSSNQFLVRAAGG
ncbi:MAG TPA: hypothetical protein VMW48_19580, partial [Vicinamibacterales bacterium]|nr:hypothetical protein [Vicinamibacterales bacterium]